MTVLRIIQNISEPAGLIVFAELFRRGVTVFKRTKNPVYLALWIVGATFFMEKKDSPCIVWLISAALYSYLHGRVFSRQEDKLIGAYLAEMFFSLVENACHRVSKSCLEDAILNFRTHQKLSFDNYFHSEKILLICPDLLPYRSKLKADSGLLFDLEILEPKSSPVQVVNSAVVVEYPMGTTNRHLEFQVLSFLKEDKKKDYFLCLDQRPLANLYEFEMTDSQMIEEQESYYNELERLVNNDPTCSARIEIVKVSGSLEFALRDLIHKYKS